MGVHLVRLRDGYRVPRRFGAQATGPLSLCARQPRTAGLLCVPLYECMGEY